MAEAGISGLKSALIEGSRANKYKISFDKGGKNLETLVKSGSVPGHTVGVAEVYSQGRKLSLAGDSTYDTWDCSIYNDNSLSNNSAIHDWMLEIDDFANNTSSASTLGAYGRDITVEQLDRRGTTVKKFILKNAWPTTIAAIDLASDSNDTVSETAVTFVYSHYEVL